MSRRTIWILLLIVLLGASAGAYYWTRSKSPTQAFNESKVARADISTLITATGTVQPENRLEIKPPIAGRIEQVLVEEGQKVKKGQILAWLSSTERAALLDAARSQGQEEVKKWEDLYRPTPVIAPIPGTIITRNIEPGQTFANTDAILVMSDRLTVKALVDETDIAQIKLKQEAEITLDAYPGQKLKAHVDQIAFEAKAVNNVTTYSVDVLPAQTPEFMRAGMTANVTFYSEMHPQVLFVPTDAVLTENGSSTVQMHDNAGELIRRPVEIGITDGKRTEITSGLIEGEVVLSAVYSSKGKAKAANNPFSPMGGRPRTGGR